MPDYFPSFRCKCGACRACCCSGWAVSISADEYFRLIGVDCSPELRRRLDRALHLLPNPTPDRCARLDPDWQGACSLQMRPAERVRRGGPAQGLPAVSPGAALRV